MGSRVRVPPRSPSKSNTWRQIEVGGPQKCNRAATINPSAALALQLRPRRAALPGQSVDAGRAVAAAKGLQIGRIRCAQHRTAWTCPQRTRAVPSKLQGHDAQWVIAILTPTTTRHVRISTQYGHAN